MRRVFGRPRDRRGARRHLGIPHRPLIRLLRAHRAADDEGKPLDAELFREQLVLRTHVVADADAREMGPCRRARACCAAEVDRPLPI